MVGNGTFSRRIAAVLVVGLALCSTRAVRAEKKRTKFEPRRVTPRLRYCPNNRPYTEYPGAAEPSPELDRVDLAGLVDVSPPKPAAK